MKPLVLVHGFLGGSDQWARQAPLATARDLIRLDLPGFGKNAHLPPIDRIESFAQWALDDLERQGIQSFDLLGHSMGGMIVQEMVRQDPTRIKRLILYGTGPIGALPDRFESIQTTKKRLQSDGISATARRIAATWFHNGEAAEDFSATAEIAGQPTIAAALAGLDAMQHWNGKDHLAHINAPTLVLWGDLDKSYGWPQIEELWRAIPECNLAVVPGVAHAVHSENPRIFNLLVEEFLSGGNA